MNYWIFGDAKIYLPIAELLRILVKLKFQISKQVTPIKFVDSPFLNSWSWQIIIKVNGYFPIYVPVATLLGLLHIEVPSTINFALGVVQNIFALFSI